MDLGWFYSEANKNPPYLVSQYDIYGFWIRDFIGEIFFYDKTSDSIRTALMFFWKLYFYIWKTLVILV